VAKVVPEKQILQQHARHLLENKNTAELIAKHVKDIARRAKATALPTALSDKVTALLEDQPALSWDQALSRIIEGVAHGVSHKCPATSWATPSRSPQGIAACFD
jgi:hypothetical protein